MSVLIDLKDFEIGTSLIDSRGGKGRVKVRASLKDPFIKGPVPLSWLLKAANLGKCALIVGLAFWYMDGMRRQQAFKMGRGDLGRLLGASRWTILRGIRRLEIEGLIFVLREPGKKMIITLNRSITHTGKD